MNEAKAYSTFELVGSNFIKAIQSQVELYTHKKTGAMHIHIAAENTENVFMVAFRTMPDCSNGVAHILEHTALCGSEKYPTRDPFFSMTRRSLNSFMNAFTSCDWTAYPFASPNRKDFDNLMDVYLDAAFFPRLAELDFKQEGHRVDFEVPGDKTSNLVFKGVVFNEMKGAMSPGDRVFYQAMQTALYPGTTYEVNSGGEPVNIPDLTYEEFKKFHAEHYHPSNAIFMTYGDLPAIQHQEKFEKAVLHKFDKLDKTFSVNDVKRFTAPKEQTISYAFDEEDTSNRTYIQMGWLLGDCTDIYENIKTVFMYMILLGDSASPMLAALESTKLGTAPKCSFIPDNKEMSFMIGVQGSEAEHKEAVEKLILETLEKVVSEGVTPARLEALLDQIEVDVRNLEAGGYPLGLSFMLNIMAHAIHGGDVLGALDVEPMLNKLREEAHKPDFVKDLINDLLLNNQHRVTLVGKPDTSLSAKKNKLEAERLAEMKSKMSEADLDAVVEQAKALDERQSAEEDLSVLPTVTMADISPEKTYPQGEVKEDAGMKVSGFRVGTNGLLTQKIVMNLPQLNERQLRILPYYVRLVTEVAIGERDYLEAGEWQTSICSSFMASSSIKHKLGSTTDVDSFVTFSASGLERHSAEMAAMMVETIETVSFRELDRIKDLVGQIKLGKENGITGSGHVIAAAAASRGMSACGGLSFKIGGLDSVRFVKELYKSFETDGELQKFADELAELHNLVKEAPRQLMTIAEDEKLDAVLSKLSGEVQKLKLNDNFKSFEAEFTGEHIGEMWVTNTQVNYCAKAFKAVPSTHEDAAPLHVLSVYLKNKYLHTAVREKGGAYGGGASYNPENGTFTMMSYRDPRISGTLADYDAAVDWMKNSKHEDKDVQEAIFGILSSIDAPDTPMKDASISFGARLHGRTDEVRRDYRARILKVTAEDVVRVAEKYLDPKEASTAVITSEDMLKNEGDLGLKVIRL